MSVQPLTSSTSPLIRGDEGTINGHERTLRQLYGRISFAGISSRNEDATDAPIESLFVEPALSEQPLSPESFDPLDVRSSGWQLPAMSGLCDVLVANERLVILGDPGTGKSTVVQWIVASLSDSVPSILRQRLRIHGEYTPIPIILRDLPPSLFTAQASPAEMWRSMLQAWLATPAGKWIASAEGLIDRIAKAGRVFFLIDGIDELPGLPARQVLRDVLWWAWDEFKDCRWLATSRIIGFQDMPVDWKHQETDVRIGLPRHEEMIGDLTITTDLQTILTMTTKAARFYLAPFDDQRVRKFSGQWFGRIIANADEAEKEAARFTEAVTAKTDTRTLGRVPNFLTLMALVWRDGLELPDGRARLYQQLSFAYLENIERHRFKDAQRPILPPVGATVQDMERWLAALAWHMQLKRDKAERTDAAKEESGLIVIKREEAEGIIAAAIRATSGEVDAGKKARGFLDYAAARSGLFLPRGAGDHRGEDWGFLHLSFQEYFAACHLRDKVGGDRWARTFLYGKGAWEDTETGIDALKEYAYHRMWHETLIFLLELLSMAIPERPGTLLRALLGAEDPFENGWPALDAPESIDDFQGPKGKSIQLSEWLAAASVDMHVSFTQTDRYDLISRCWEWELNWQAKSKAISTANFAFLSRVLMARGSAVELSLSPLVSLARARSLDNLRLSGVRGIVEFPMELLLPSLSGILIADFPALDQFPPVSSNSKLIGLYLIDCPALTVISSISASSIQVVNFGNCGSLKSLPNLTDLHSLRLGVFGLCKNLERLPAFSPNAKISNLFIHGCDALSPDSISEFRKQFPECEISGMNLEQELFVNSRKIDEA